MNEKTKNLILLIAAFLLGAAITAVVAFAILRPQDTS